MSSNADRNLLFGILALQIDLLRRDQLIDGMNAWVLLKERSLGDVLVEKGHLDHESKDAIERLVEKRIDKNEGDLHRTLALVRSVSPEFHDEMAAIGDSDIQASLAQVASATNVEATQAFTGKATSDGRFAILHLHDKGGLGEIFVAKDCELNRQVALKQIQDRYAHDAMSRSRFLLEAELTGCLEHPGIVPVYGLGHHEDGRPYYAMRLIHGESLQKRIEQFHDVGRRAERSASEQTLEFRKLLGQFVDVCQAVEYAHSRGVVHRDLKPSNVMVGRFGETLVVDWGLAKALGSPDERSISEEAAVVPSSGSSATEMGSAIGTPAFMPPEQAAGRLDLVGPVSDVYSLGATLYNMITGTSPFDGQSHEVLEDVKSGSFLRPREVDPKVSLALEAICLKAMRREPQDRYGSASELAQEVDRWLADEPVVAWPDPVAARLKRAVKHHRVVVTGVTAALLVTLASLAIGLVVVTDKNRQLHETAEQASRNFRQAKGIVDEFLTKVSESQELLGGTAGTQQLRNNLLDMARVYYEDFIQENESFQLHEELGAAYLRLAKLHAEIGSEEEAAEEYRKAIDILERTIGPQSAADYRANLVHACTELGNLHRWMSRWHEAESSYQKAIKLGEELVRQSPSNPEYQEELAHACGNLGVQYRHTRRLDEAPTPSERALRIRERLVREHPTVPAFQAKLVADYNMTGQLYQLLGRLDDAAVQYRKATEVGERLVRQHPLPEYQYFRRDTHERLGSLYKLLGRLDEAEQQWTKGIEVALPLVQQNPLVPVYKLGLGLLYSRLGGLYQERGKLPEAEEQFANAIEIHEQLVQENPSVPGYKVDLAYAYNTPAWLYATCFDEAFHDPDKALAHATRACTLTNWTDSVCLETLAAAHAIAGDFQAAVEWQSKALQLAAEDTEEEARSRLQLYRSGKPYRQPPPNAERT